MTRGYVIEPSPLVLRDLTGGATHRAKWDATIVLVGCGGTGSQVVDKLCKLLIGRRAQLFLCDPDRVEPKNVGRQAFLYGIRRVRQYFAAQECDSGR